MIFCYTETENFSGKKKTDIGNELGNQSTSSECHINSLVLGNAGNI